MNKAKVMASVAVVSLGLVFFNNCSDVGFQKTASEAERAASASSFTDLAEEAQDILERVPPEQIDDPVPVSELERDPSLYDLYSCGDSGVMICHFPENVEAQSSNCVGRSAVRTHYDHIRQYIYNGVQKQIGDYLGPCRIPL